MPDTIESPSATWAITVDWDLSNVNAFFARYESQFDDVSGNAFGVGMEAAAEDWLAGMRVRYVALSQGGGEWPMTSPAYTKRKLKATGYDLIGFYSRRLFESLYRGGVDNYWQPIPDGIVFGSDVEYAQFFSHGTNRQAARVVEVYPDDPLMPTNTMDNMVFEMEKGWQNIVNECSEGLD